MCSAYSGSKRVSSSSRLRSCTISAPIDCSSTSVLTSFFTCADSGSHGDSAARCTRMSDCSRHLYIRWASTVAFAPSMHAHAPHQQPATLISLGADWGHIPTRVCRRLCVSPEWEFRRGVVHRIASCGRWPAGVAWRGGLGDKEIGGCRGRAYRRRSGSFERHAAL